MIEERVHIMVELIIGLANSVCSMYPKDKKSSIQYIITDYVDYIMTD